jgi:DNA-binding CsgD family transcriptional regulator
VARLTFSRLMPARPLVILGHASEAIQQHRRRRRLRGEVALGTDDLLERDSELTVIREAMTAAARARAGRTLIIEGPAGIGKTSLLAAGAQIASALGALVAHARGGELERNFSFGVVRQLLETPVSTLDTSERARVLSGAARTAVPVVDPSAVTAPLPGEHASADERTFMISHGLYWLVCNLTDTTPLFLAVDDAQWCDTGSAWFLSYLARRLDDLPVLLAVAVRPGEPEGEAAAAALADGQARVLRPRPLSVTAASQIVRRELAADAGADFCRECCQVSGGNPFLLGALLDELAAERITPVSANAPRLAGVRPKTVTRGLLARLARLGPDAVSLARAVAVLGSAELRESAALAGVELASAARAAAALAEADILAPQQRLEFAHPLVRNVVYESIPPAQRAFDHGRAAWLFSAPVADQERMAAHLLQAAPSGDARVVDVLREAAGLAMRRGAAGTACAQLRRALREPPSPAQLVGVIRGLAVAELQAREPGAVERLGEALSITEQPVPRAEIGLLLGKALINAGRTAEAEPVLTRAIGELGEHDRDLALRLETWRSGLGVLSRQFRADLEQRLPQLRALAERGGLAGRGLLVVLAYRAAMDGASRKAVVDLADHGLDDGRFLTAETDGLPLPFAMRLLGWIDELDRADRVHQSLLAAAREGSIVAFTIAAVCAASTALRRGQLAVAEAEGRTAIGLSVQHDLKFYEPFARALAGEALLERGKLDHAGAAVDSIDLGRIRGSGPSGLLLYVRGRLRAARGDRDGAASDLRECGDIYEAMGYCNPNILPWRSALASVLPDRPDAQVLVDTELDRARRAGQPRGIGIALRASALLGERGQRVPLLREAVSTIRLSPSMLELARTLTEYGTALARGGERASARAPLQEAMDLAARSGAQPLEQRAREELRAIGARPRRERLTGVESLTHSELGVARLAAQGLTNRQIAQALFVSTKTVGTHLGHIYGKLSVNNRVDLAETLLEASPAQQ